MDCGHNDLHDYNDFNSHKHDLHAYKDYHDHKDYCAYGDHAHDLHSYPIFIAMLNFKHRTMATTRTL